MQKIKKLLMLVFQICMPSFMLLGAMIVVGQLGGIFLGDGKLLVGIYKSLYTWASNATGVCLFAAFMYSYIE